jgi:magnesium-transporting ATPase (P-type)
LVIAVQLQDLDDSVREEIIEHMETMAGEGLRTIGLAYHDVADVEAVRLLEDAPTDDMRMTFIALVGIRDPPRKVAAHRYDP